MFKTHSQRGIVFQPCAKEDIIKFSEETLNHYNEGKTDEHKNTISVDAALEYFLQDNKAIDYFKLITK